MVESKRTPVREKAKQFAKLLREDAPDYDYLRELFRHLRKELEVSAPKKTETQQASAPISIEKLANFYNIIKQEGNNQSQIIIKTLLYTGIRVSELVNIFLEDIDSTKCQILIRKGVGNRERIVPFPKAFEKELAAHVKEMQLRDATYLFESSWKGPYTERGIRKMMGLYSKKAGLKENISPNSLRKFLLSWLKQQGIEDAMIQPYSGLVSREALAKYDIDTPKDTSGVQSGYESIIGKLPF